MVKRLVVVRRSVPGTLYLWMGPPSARPPSGKDAGEDFCEHALASAVRPDYPEALAALDAQV